MPLSVQDDLLMFEFFEKYQGTIDISEMSLQIGRKLHLPSSLIQERLENITMKFNEKEIFCLKKTLDAFKKKGKENFSLVALFLYSKEEEKFLPVNFKEVEKKELRRKQNEYFWNKNALIEREIREETLPKGTIEQSKERQRDIRHLAVTSSERENWEFTVSKCTSENPRPHSSLESLFSIEFQEFMRNRIKINKVEGPNAPSRASMQPRDEEMGCEAKETRIVHDTPGEEEAINQPRDEEMDQGHGSTTENKAKAKMDALRNLKRPASTKIPTEEEPKRISEKKKSSELPEQAWRKDKNLDALLLIRILDKIALEDGGIYTGHELLFLMKEKKFTNIQQVRSWVFRKT